MEARLLLARAHRIDICAMARAVSARLLHVICIKQSQLSAASKPVTQKLIRVKSDPAGSLLVAIIDPAGSLLTAKSDPPLQKVIRVQILVDSSLF